MKKYRCHKVVEAAKVVKAERAVENEYGAWAIFYLEDGSTHHGDEELYLSMRRFDPGVGDPGYLVRHDNGCLSWSPTKAFERGYHPLDCPEGYRLGHVEGLGKRHAEDSDRMAYDVVMKDDDRLG